jgi:D-alanyl-D-alanine carboxypeptidase
MACSDENSTETDRALVEELQDAIDTAEENFDLKGISAAVVAEGEDAWVGCSGRSDDTVTLSPEMLFHIGSCGKNYTATLVLQLAEESRLSLDDSLHEWLPPFTHVDSTITVYQLLNHTSGLHNYAEDPGVWDVIFADPLRIWTPEEVIRQFLREPYFAPGEGWHYSNANYLLLGMIIREATGSEISEELGSRFFDPLILDQTFFAGEEDISGDMAHNWYDYDQDGTADDMSTMPMNSLYSFAWTSGAIVTTAEDLAKWGNLLYGGAILTPASLDAMLTFYPRQEYVVTGYGLGSERYELHGKTLYGHSGGGVGYTSVLMYLPEDGVSFAVLINQVTDHVLDVAGELVECYLSHD